VSYARSRRLFIVVASLIAALALAMAFVIGTLASRQGASAGASVAVPANPDVDFGDSAGGTPAPQFVLRDQDDRLTSLAQFRGKVVVLAFVDSQCTSICPLTTESMVQALRLLGPTAARVQLLGINANPLALTVADVAAYTRAHEMQADWRFLTGSLPELKRVWRGYHVYVAAVHNDIDHQPVVMLIDGQGRERTVYFTQFRYEGVLQQAQVLADGISRLLTDDPVIHDQVSLKYVQPLAPTSVVRLPVVGEPSEAVLIGGTHAHLLVFFASWLSSSTDLRARLGILERYAAAARQHGWPSPIAVDELPTEPSSVRAREVLPRLAGRLSVPLIEDTQGRLGDGYGVQDLPWFVLTAPTGRALWRHDGWLSLGALQAQVQARLRSATRPRSRDAATRARWPSHA